jgi:hypothetical protein
MLERWFKKREARKDAIAKAREGFVSWREISVSLGWKTYEEKIEKKIEVIKNKIENDTLLTGEDLKRLQLALQVWKEVKRIPKELQDNAGGK